MSKYLSLIFLVSLLSACGTCPWEDSESPSIDSLTMSADEVAPGDNIDVNIEVSFFELRGPEGHSHEDGSSHHHESTSACPGGHWHLYIDDLLTNPVAQSVTEGLSFDLPEDTASGSHTLIARLHNEDHTIHLSAGQEITAELNFEVSE